MKIILCTPADCEERYYLEARMIEKDIPFKVDIHPCYAKPMLKIGHEILNYNEAVEFIRKM